MRLVLAALLLVIGCPRPPLPTAAERDELVAVERAWVSAGLGDPGNCLAGTRIRDVSPEEADRQCQAPAYSCLLRESSAPLHGSYWMIVVSQPETRLRDIRHEALHALVRCVLRPGLHADPYDAGHTDPRVWGSGGAESVEQRAQTRPARRFFTPGYVAGKNGSEKCGAFSSPRGGSRPEPPLGIPRAHAVPLPRPRATTTRPAELAAGHEPAHVGLGDASEHCQLGGREGTLGGQLRARQSGGNHEPERRLRVRIGCEPVDVDVCAHGGRVERDQRDQVLLHGCVQWLAADCIGCQVEHGQVDLRRAERRVDVLAARQPWALARWREQAHRQVDHVIVRCACDVESDGLGGEVCEFHGAHPAGISTAFVPAAAAPAGMRTPSIVTYGITPPPSRSRRGPLP